MDKKRHGELVQNHDGSAASCGFYGQRFRSGLTIFTRDEGVLVSPDPLYARALANPRLRPRIEELYRGCLSSEQAAMLNDWTTDDGNGAFALTRFQTSDGEQRERAIITTSGVYAGLATLFPSGVDNCATWIERQFPGCIECPYGMPRLCRAAQESQAEPS